MVSQGQQPWIMVLVPTDYDLHRRQPLRLCRELVALKLTEHIAYQGARGSLMGWAVRWDRLLCCWGSILVLGSTYPSMAGL